MTTLDRLLKKELSLWQRLTYAYNEDVRQNQQQKLNSCYGSGVRKNKDESICLYIRAYAAGHCRVVDALHRLNVWVNLLIFI